MSAWARATIVVFNRERHVGFVVCAVKIFAIPASREEDLRSQTIGTIVSGKSTSLWVAGTLVVVQTVIADCLRSKIIAGCSLERISRYHAETFWEGLQFIVVGSSTLEVVYQTTTNLIHFFKGAILVLKVQNRCPVIGVVAFNSA